MDSKYIRCYLIWAKALSKIGELEEAIEVLTHGYNHDKENEKINLYMAKLLLKREI